jgi:CheY-like chemotaxis protein
MNEIVPRKESEIQNSIKTLIVEDDPMNSEVVSVEIEDAGGFQQSSTDNVSDALNILRTFKLNGQQIDLIISDLGLIGNREGGLEIAKAAKAEKLASRFVLYTANRDYGFKSREELEGLGINVVATKPLNSKGWERLLNNEKNILRPPKSAQ